jgi:hypothetical protein
MRTRDDCGSTSLAIVLTAPILVVLMFAGFQAAMWNHTRTEARVVAREAALSVARDRVPAAEASRFAESVLRNDSLLQDPLVDVALADGRVVVTITGRAPGVIRFTSGPVSVRAAVAVEGWVPL